MRKSILKILLVVCFVCLTVFGASGCSLLKQRFEKNGLAITLTKEFSEETHEDYPQYTAYYVSPKMVVITLEETFAALETVNKNGDWMSAEDYAELVLLAYRTTYNSASEISQDNGFVYFTYENDFEGKDYAFLWCGYKSFDSFWSVQFGCVKKDLKKLKGKMLSYARTVQVEKAVVSDLKFRKINGKEEYEVAGQFTEKADMVIPKTYKGLPVTRIGNGAFSKASLKSISIPDSITSIGNRSFADCASLQAVVVPDSVTTMEYSAFEGCIALKEITLPNGLTEICEYTFRGCVALTDISLPDSVTRIETSAFENCRALKEIALPNGLTSLGERVFADCKELTAMAIPSGIENVWSALFYGCEKLTEISIPDGIKTIDSWAFGGCVALTEITLPSGVTSIGNAAFCGCTTLKSIVIPDGVTEIEMSAFSDCTSLKSVTFPQGLTKISFSAFGSCTALTDIVLPDGLCVIDMSAFYNCTALQSMVVPDSVLVVWEYAFATTEALTSIYYTGTAEQKETLLGNVKSDNAYLTGATWYYYSEEQPPDKGNYWRYVDGKPTAW
ncbi:MAG: leucine-rich repeat domain-containing protein [Clostridia bacterium]|nr:leucine-rich repeat domain-containing protein [Clostridia bacterium]